MVTELPQINEEWHRAPIDTKNGGFTGVTWVTPLPIEKNNISVAGKFSDGYSLLVWEFVRSIIMRIRGSKAGQKPISRSTFSKEMWGPISEVLRKAADGLNPKYIADYAGIRPHIVYRAHSGESPKMRCISIESFRKLCSVHSLTYEDFSHIEGFERGMIEPLTEEERDKFGETLKIIRKLRGDSIKSSSIGSGVSISTINVAIEKNKDNPDVYGPHNFCIRKLLNYYRISLDDLWNQVRTEAYPEEIARHFVNAPKKQKALTRSSSDAHGVDYNRHKEEYPMALLEHMDKRAKRERDRAAGHKSIREIAKETGIPKSTVHRILNSGEREPSNLPVENKEAPNTSRIVHPKAKMSSSPEKMSQAHLILAIVAVHIASVAALCLLLG